MGRMNEENKKKIKLIINGRSTILAKQSVEGF